MALRTSLFVLLALTCCASACSDGASDAPNGAAGSPAGGAQPAGAGSAGKREQPTAGDGASAGGGSAGLGAGGTSGSGSAGTSAAGTGGAGAGGAGVGGQAGAASSNGSIVPLYTYPTHASWAAICAAKQAHPSVVVIAIVNPNSGPGSAVESEFTKGIASLVAAGVVPIGYVSTDYTKRGLATVKADVDHWHAWYPKVQGIFFDEQSNQAGDEQFYRDASAYTKAQGMTLTVGNPGTGVAASYLDTVDVMTIYESAGVPSLASLNKYAAARGHYAIIPYAATFDAAFVKSARASVGYVYLTNDDLPNPWDSLPTTFDALLAALEP